MKYMLLIAGADEGWDHLDEAGQRALYGQIETWWDERKAAGELLEGAQLQPSSTATTVRRGIEGNATSPSLTGRSSKGKRSSADTGSSTCPI